jgi:RimJ/RimL family protein N-acetyltransferase
MENTPIEILCGQYATLRPVDAEAQTCSLHLNLSHPKLWEYFEDQPYLSEEKFK